MKKISQEEFNHLLFQPRGAALTECVKKVLSLSINEAIVIGIKEWELKSKPSVYFSANQEKFNGMYFTVRTLANEEGWAILRIA